MKNNKIEIYINGEKKIVNNKYNLQEVLNIFSIKSKLVAVEVNKEVVPKSHYKSKKIVRNDKIEVLELIGGG